MPAPLPVLHVPLTWLCLRARVASLQAPAEVAALRTEIEVLSHLRHPHIVRYIGSERFSDVLSIFMELVPGGSLASCLRRFGPCAPPLVARFTRQLLSALEYLHGRGVVHRDVKCANLLLQTDGNAKLTDFGASLVLARGASSTGVAAGACAGGHAASGSGGLGSNVPVLGGGIVAAKCVAAPAASRPALVADQPSPPARD